MCLWFGKLVLAVLAALTTVLLLLFLMLLMLVLPTALALHCLLLLRPKN
jgi:hypothetical protein